MSDDILNAALEYLDMGFSIIPVRKDNKRPYLPTWKEFQSRQPSPEQVEAWWEQWPEANVAIITGDISKLCVVDADGPKGCEWVAANLPKTGVYSQTSPGRMHAVYKTNGTSVKNMVRLAPEVDIRGEGGYFVAPPSIHASGHQYQWNYLMDGWDDLTEFDMSLISTPKKSSGSGNLNIDLTLTKASPVNEGVNQGERNNTLAQLAGKWFGKGLDTDEVIDLARSWNEKNNPPLPEAELLKTIQSINRTDASNHPEKYIESDSVPQEGIQPSERDIPEHLLHPGGTLECLMAYIDQNAAVSVPLYNLGSSLVFFGNVLGQKLSTETGLRTNLYVICLGYSGTGKNAPFSTLPQLLLYSDAAETSGPTEITSSVSIFKWLSEHNHRISLMMIDELGQVMKGLKNPNSAAADVPRMLTKLFSATDRPETKNYADGTTLVIPWCHLSLYGASTPEQFWESLTPGDITSGFLARTLIFDSRHDAPYPKDTIAFKYNQKLIDQINALYGIETKIDPQRGNLEMVPIPKVIPRTVDAQRYFGPWGRKHHDMKNTYKTDQNGVGSVYGRSAEHAAKIALIHAASKDGADVREVGYESIRYACDLVDYLSEYTVKQIRENVCDTDIARWKNKIISGIRHICHRRHINGATLRDLQRGPCQGLLSKDIKMIIDSMLIAEAIGKRDIEKPNGKYVTEYYVAESAD